MCSDPRLDREAFCVHAEARPRAGRDALLEYERTRAITDALRLSRGMTYKNAVAGLNLGGGKSIIIGDNKTKDREKIFRAHGRFVESLGGRYITAEDVGTSTKDMDYVHMETGHVPVSPEIRDRLLTGTEFRAVQASATRMWGSDSLAGKLSP